jgi:thiamine pyrophosphokinase
MRWLPTAARTGCWPPAPPEAVIGDFDSIRPAARTALPPDRLHPIAEQDTTDFDKALCG